MGPKSENACCTPSSCPNIADRGGWLVDPTCLCLKCSESRTESEYHEKSRKFFPRKIQKSQKNLKKP